MLYVQNWCGVLRYCWMIISRVRPGMYERVSTSQQVARHRTASHGTARRYSPELALRCSTEQPAELRPGILLSYSDDVSCKFDKYRVDTHLCKLSTTSIIRRIQKTKKAKPGFNV